MPLGPIRLGYLAQHMLDTLGSRIKRPISTAISAEAARLLLAYDWPGNVRELENYLERAVAIGDGGELTAAQLPAKVVNYQPTRLELPIGATAEMVTLDEMERRYVRQVLASVKGNKTHAARVLGIDRRSLYRRLEAPTGTTPPVT
jgi:two-component system response regulator HydG